MSSMNPDRDGSGDLPGWLTTAAEPGRITERTFGELLNVLAHPYRILALPRPAGERVLWRLQRALDEALWLADLGEQERRSAIELLPGFLSQVSEGGLGNADALSYFWSGLLSGTERAAGNELGSELLDALQRQLELRGPPAQASAVAALGELRGVSRAADLLKSYLRKAPQENIPLARSALDSLTAWQERSGGS